MAACPTKKIPVYYKGQYVGHIGEDKLMPGFNSSPGCGCHEKGRNHLMYRESAYLTYCIYNDCDWEF